MHCGLMGGVLPGKDKLHDQRVDHNDAWRPVVPLACPAASPGWWVSGAGGLETRPRHRILVGRGKSASDLTDDAWLLVRAAAGAACVCGEECVSLCRGPQLMPTSRGDTVR